MHFLIVGGSDAGISAGLRAHELDPACEITLVLSDEYPNYSICGLPFFLSGETPDWHSLAHRTEFPGIRVLARHTAEHIDPGRKVASIRDGLGVHREFTYDKLLIATGARPVKPDFGGLDLPGVFPLHTMEDSLRIHAFLEREDPTSVIIVGAGYIGLEMADALRHRGLRVTVASRTDAVLATVDPDYGALVETELRRNGVEVWNRVEATSIHAADGQLTVRGARDFSQSADMVLVAVGVKPNSELGANTGIAIGFKSALRVSREMQTNVPDIFAAGDCVETWHRLLDRYTYLPLGTTAHKQGRVAGENAVGGQRQFEGSLGTQVVKLFELVTARTGLRHEEAKRAGFDPFTSDVVVWDHKAYYPGARQMHLRVTGDRGSGQLLGAQLIGHIDSEVSKRIDVFATALYHRMRVEGLNHLDLSYTPPLSSPWDPIQMAAQSWCQARNSDMASRT